MAPDQLVANVPSGEFNPSLTRTKAKARPDAFTWLQLIVPSHLDTSMPSTVCPLAHDVTSLPELPVDSPGVPPHAKRPTADRTTQREERSM